MNNVVNIIDRQFNPLGQVDDYESLMLTKSFSGIGSFELHLHENTTYVDVLVKENIIFTTAKKAYVILHREINSANGKVVIKGQELKSYLKRWLIFPPEGQAYYRVNSDAETIIKEYVTATLARKGITNILVAENENRGIKTVYQSRYKNLADELEKLSLSSGLGWDIILDIENKRFIFDVIEGQDRTASQDILPPAIFAIEYDNIGKQELIESRSNYRNVAIVGGQGEGVNRAISIVGDAEGFDSYETFIDARDIENNEDLTDRGQQKLTEYQEVLTFDSEVLTNRNLKYEEDFKLGDLVTVQNKKWDITLDTRISTVTEIYESTGFRIDITFGNNIPTLIDVVKKATDMPMAEGGSAGEPGTPGQDGVGLEYIWNGTLLGVKREDEITYQYVNLVGPQGTEGKQGLPGLNGKSLEFHWNETQLGIRVEGQSAYQYINLKGDQGPSGKNIEFNWNGTQLGIRVEGQPSYQYVNLKGEKGDTGPKGDDGYTPIKGVDYFDGEQGPIGPQGPKGDKGDIGPQGPQGEQGPEGPQGPTGTVHLGSYVRSITDTYNEYPMGVSTVFVRSNEGWPSFGTTTTLKGYSAGGSTLQIYTPYAVTYGGRELMYRIWQYGATEWDDWRVLGGGGTKIISSATEPAELSAGDQWHKEI